MLDYYWADKDIARLIDSHAGNNCSNLSQIPPSIYPVPPSFNIDQVFF